MDIPTLHIVANSIPSAFYRTLKAVCENGIDIRTEYDRKDSNGDYIDPPSKDARVLVEIKDPLSEPRFPPISFCEIGVYIAELLGIKDHLVVSNMKLMNNERLESKEWPYTYHQRLCKYPHPLGGGLIDQLELLVERLNKTPYSRRAVATTAIPYIDCNLKDDIPCLREVQLRCFEHDFPLHNSLNMGTVWRSRDLYKAWCDNVIGMTFLQHMLCREGKWKSNQVVIPGSYTDFSSSLHVYGQDLSAIYGNAEKGIKGFFDNYNEESFIDKSMTSEKVRDCLIIPQLENLLTKEKIKEWKFDTHSIKKIESLLYQFTTWNLLP